MSSGRLRSNVQVRASGIDGSVWLLGIGLILSSVVLLTLLGTSGDARKMRKIERSMDTMPPPRGKR